MEKIQEKYPGVSAEVYPIQNDFFGTSITVSGLVTGQDLIRQLTGRDLGEQLLIPCNMLRAGENVFLDDRTVEMAEDALQISIDVVETEGADLVRSVLGEQKETTHRRRQIYEQADCSDCGKA